MSSSNNPSIPLIAITRNRPTNSNIVRTQRTTERSIGCNTDASPTDPSRKTEIDEEDELTDIIERLIHDFLARPSRRQPYKSYFSWTIKPENMPMYRVVLTIAQDPSITTLV
ncbi:unnamed protein product [Rotaria socialis]|uniref:Uncharacterized protein n=1 Tax=Rotaria socialis TaxID=392032 RepID=A0A819WET4_9BILA|nr:unnamed protein product [Rotaria socialis]CAF3467798.1 unnamed protein product [Rotaria socialis]CAF3547749.1 unnamed protein product [Rotaria socialis]CAF3768734.1 unnamed protein product [Rotaria socialis]CAF4123424.1 unnamed protein product [Rotaria socialis]